MIDLGTVKPGSTIRIPVNTFDSNDPSASVTATTWLNTDCHIHKDGGTTQRASSAGETLSIDFDSVTGNHILELDLADNTTADFYQAGSEYHVRIEGVTVDGATDGINAWIARFRIGYPGAILDTFIATLASQTSFTLNEGPAEASALVGCTCVVHDAASKVQMAIGYISAYAVTTKTVTLAADPGIFTMAAKDNISIFMPSNVQAWRGGLVPAPNTAGYPLIDIYAVNGSLVTDTVAGFMDVNATHVSGSTTAANNAEVVFDTDFATAYNTTRNAWATNVQDFVGTSAADPFNGQVVAASVTGAVGSVTAGVTLAAGAVTDASLAGNMEIVFETDFATNYNATRNAWATNVQDFVGTSGADPFNGQVVAASVTGAVGSVTNDLSKYNGPRGPGVYLNDAAGNTNTTSYTDGIITNPVSTIGAAKTIADALSLDRIYIINDSTPTLAATMTDYEFVGIGSTDGNVLALASQDVSNSSFYNLKITGVQGGSGRADYWDCYFGTATIYCHCHRCGFEDNVTGVTLANQADNFLDACYSMVAGNGTPIFICSGANLDASFRHYSGGLELKSTNATATISVETDGQVIFNADCNVNSNITMRGWMTITDNTAGMNNLTYAATAAGISNKDGNLTYDMSTDSLEAIRDNQAGAAPTAAAVADAVWDEAQADHVAAGSFGEMATETAAILVDTGTTIPATIATAQADLDTITGTDGVTLATAQANYAPATAPALATAQADLDTITGTGGVLIATAQTAAAWSALEASAGQIIEATVDTVTNTHTPTTTEFQADDVTEATADHYNGRIVVFTSGVLAGQATDITDYAAVGGIGQFTVTAMTEAPSNNDTFIIV